MSAPRPILAVAALGIALVAVTARGTEPEALPPEASPITQALEVDTLRVRAVLDALRGANPVQCELVLHALEVSYTPRAESPVPDREPEAWALARWATSRLRDSRVVPRLASALRDPDHCVPRLAARMLGRSRLPAARASLLGALRDPEPAIRRLGALGLGFDEDRSSLTPLVRALDDRDPGVRAAAAWALGAMH